MRQFFRSALAALLAVPLVAGPATASSGTDKEAVVVDRLAGADRWQTAALISGQFPDGVDTVFIANGEDWAQGADAVVAGAAAGSGTVPPVITDASGRPAPILLARVGGLPGATRAALAELQPDHAVVLGGPAVLSTVVVQELLTLGIEPVRVAGTDRYGTAAALATTFEPGTETLYIASGVPVFPSRFGEGPPSLPDALTASTRAGAEDAPVLLTQLSSVPESTRAALETLQPQSITIVGGYNAVALSVEIELQEIAPVTRVSGDTRYATAAALFADYPAGAPMTYLASGTWFADVLSVSPLAASQGAAVQLSRSHDLISATEAALVALDPAAVRLVGGEKVLAESVMQEVRDLLGG